MATNYKTQMDDVFSLVALLWFKNTFDFDKLSIILSLMSVSLSLCVFPSPSLPPSLPPSPYFAPFYLLSKLAFCVPTLTGIVQLF